MASTPKTFEKLYAGFNTPIYKKFDCGKFCAPLNKGEPVCCTTGNAVPVVDKAEWRLLKSRSDLWHAFNPFDAQTRTIVADLPKSCMAIECKGAAFCERDNRSLACRAFPFYPYFQKDGTLFGLSTYWAFEDRCWVMSNLALVELDFVRELVQAYEMLFAVDEDEEQAFMDNSVDHRRVFSRWGRDLPVIGREGGFFKIEPHSGGRIMPADAKTFKKHAPYNSQKSYLQAIKNEGGVVKNAPTLPFVK